MKMAHLAAAAALTLTFALPGPTRANDAFPSRPIRLVVPSAPGGALDVNARLLALKMGERLGQPVVVDNKPGADSLLGTRLAKDAPADGYTLVAHTSTLTALPALKTATGFDLAKDFIPIGPMLRAPQLMVVSGEQPMRNLRDFITAAKTQKLSYASAGTGTTLHLGAAMFLLQQRAELLHVPYKGAGVALPDVAAGRVTMMFGGYSGVAPYLQSGKLRALGVTSHQRLSAAPGVPTFAEQGVDYQYTFWVGVLAPAGTPAPVVKKLSEAIQFAVQSKEVRDRVLADGSEPWWVPPEEFARYLAQEASTTAKLVSDLGIAKE